MNHILQTLVAYPQAEDKQQSQPQTTSLSTHAHWGLRFALASVFVYHGSLKLLGLQEFASMMDLPYFVALLVAFAETAGGIGIIAGGLLQSRIGDIITRLAGLAIIPVMLGAIFMVHWGQWNFVPSATHQMGGMEFQVTLMLLALFFVIKGNRA